MTAVRNVVTDLIDRRLWPVALALLAALVAVPVLLGGGSSAPAGPPAAPLAGVPAATAGTAKAAIALSTPSTDPQYRPGPVRNPFVQHQVKPLPSTTNAQVTPAPSATPVGAPSAPVTVAPAPSSPVTPITPAAPRPVAPLENVWRVNLRFGEPGNQKVRKGVPRLSPLPSATNPFFVFLGVLSDGKTAVFLVSSDATANGDGTCKPNPTQCDTVEMRAGDTEFFDVAQGNAGIVQYELDLLKVFHSKVSGKAAVARAARISADGHNVVKELKTETDPSLGRYIYSHARGLLVRRHGLKASVSAVASSTAPDTGAHASTVFGTSWGG